MVRKPRESNGGAEQIDANAEMPESPARVLRHGRDPSAGRHVEAPRPVDAVLEFCFEELCPFVVGLAGGAGAVAGQKQRQVT